EYGLWGLRIDAGGDHTPGALKDPRTSAAALVARSRAAGGKLSWHPAWRNLRRRRLVAELRRELAGAPRTQPVAELAGLGALAAADSAARGVATSAVQSIFNMGRAIGGLLP
ncbi:MAG: hypothetical protein ACREN5_14675, partial [Gemmatimonadales bacterium]